MRPNKAFNRGVYVLPNLFTTANLLFGFMSILASIQIALRGGENYKRCAVYIFIAAIFDMIDGRVARKTNTATKFGVEYDSLCDLISFGLAPTIMIYLWGLKSLGKVGWVGVFLFVACGALRLARFNVQSGSVEKKYFQGLPIPMAAMMLVGSVLIWGGMALKDDSDFPLWTAQIIILCLTYVLSLLMVSEIPYRSFKALVLSRRLPFHYMVFVTMVFMLIALHPWEVLYILGCVYLVWAPVEKYLLKKDLTIEDPKPLPQQSAPGGKPNKDEKTDPPLRSIR